MSMVPNQNGGNSKELYIFLDYFCCCCYCFNGKDNDVVVLVEKRDSGPNSFTVVCSVHTGIWVGGGDKGCISPSFRKMGDWGIGTSLAPIPHFSSTFPLTFPFPVYAG